MRSSFTMTKVNKDRFPWDWPQTYNYQRDRFPRDCPSHPEIHFLISGIRASFLGQWRLLQRHTCRFKMYKVTFSGWMEKITWGEVWRSWWTCRGQKRSMQIQHSGLLRTCKVKIGSEGHSIWFSGKNVLKNILKIKAWWKLTKLFLPGNPLSQMSPARGGIPGLDNFNVLNEDMLNSWRKSLEQSLLGQNPLQNPFYPPPHGAGRPAPDFPYPPEQPKRSESPDTSRSRSRSATPHAERATPSLELVNQESLQESKESKTPSEDGGISPPRATELEVSSGPIKVRLF